MIRKSKSSLNIIPTKKKLKSKNVFLSSQTVEQFIKKKFGTMFIFFYLTIICKSRKIINVIVVTK